MFTFAASSRPRDTGDAADLTPGVDELVDFMDIGLRTHGVGLPLRSVDCTGLASGDNENHIKFAALTSRRFA